MTREKWQEILGNIKDNFEFIDQGKEHLEEEGGIDVEFVVFTSPQGKFRLEFVEQPVILDKKTSYSRRIGSETTVNYVYSDSEKSSRLIAYKWDQGIDDWAEMDSNLFANN